MTYTNNVPQGNQTIAETTDPIRNNFAFLETHIGEEHNFDATGAQVMYHFQASMPNQAAPALPAGTNGMYYVDGGRGKFFEGSNRYDLNLWTNVQTGTFTATSSFTTIAIIPANSVGMIILYQQAATGATMMGAFCSDSSTFAWSMREKKNGSSGEYPVELNNFNSGSLNLQGKKGDFDPGAGNNYKYVLFSRPVT